jgi:hypothetical protein
MTSLPPTARPPRTALIAVPLVAAARITWAPPIRVSPAAVSVAWLSM